MRYRLRRCILNIFSKKTPYFFTITYYFLLIEGAVQKVPTKKQAVPKGTACKIFVEKRLVQWKNQPFGDIMKLL